METYIFKQYDTVYCNVKVTMTLKVNLIHRSEWAVHGISEPIPTVQALLDQKDRAVEITDVISDVHHQCSYDLISKQFPNLDWNDYIPQSESVWTVHEGYVIDKDSFEAEKRRLKLPPYDK